MFSSLKKWFRRHEQEMHANVHAGIERGMQESVGVYEAVKFYQHAGYMLSADHAPTVLAQIKAQLAALAI